MDKYIDCIHPPPIDDQRFIELMAFRFATISVIVREVLCHSFFRFLNDFSSPACQQCVRFVSSVDLEGMIDPSDPEGFKPILTHLAQVGLICFR